VRRMVDDPVDRQRHILHQPVHAALSLVAAIGSILSILPLQRRPALLRGHRSSSVTTPAPRRQRGNNLAPYADEPAYHRAFPTLLLARRRAAGAASRSWLARRQPAAVDGDDQH